MPCGLTDEYRLKMLLGPVRNPSDDKIQAFYAGDCRVIPVIRTSRLTSEWSCAGRAPKTLVVVIIMSLVTTLVLAGSAVGVMCVQMINIKFQVKRSLILIVGMMVHHLLEILPTG